MNELLRATQFLRSTILLVSLNPKTWSLNGNMHDKFEHASSSLQMYGTWHCTAVAMPKRPLKQGNLINCSNNTEAPWAHRGTPLKLKNNKNMFLGQPNLRQPNLGIAEKKPHWAANLQILVEFVIFERKMALTPQKCPGSCPLKFPGGCPGGSPQVPEVPRRFPGGSPEVPEVPGGPRRFPGGFPEVPEVPGGSPEVPQRFPGGSPEVPRRSPEVPAGGSPEVIRTFPGGSPEVLGVAGGPGGPGFLRGSLETL